MSFPTIFLDGRGDPTNHATTSTITENETESFAQKIKHLIRFAEKIDGSWTYKFAAHPRFAYWSYNILYRRRLLGQGNFFQKQNPGEANMTTEELREMLHFATYSKVLSKLMQCAKNVTGTNAYWNQIKQELKTAITQVGAPTILWTLSCADFHWSEFHLFLSQNSSSNDQFHQNVINNSHIVVWLFAERTEKFVNWWLYKTLGAKWHWFR